MIETPSLTISRHPASVVLLPTKFRIQNVWNATESRFSCLVWQLKLSFDLLNTAYSSSGSSVSTMNPAG
eukprot:m.168351 g.168351  ORF g.168351 m.168351 type:complete len:69 (+) comp14473_c0_seq6:383-589(+)